MSLQNPLTKMSKSDPDPNSAIYLADSDDMISKKFRKAVTDSGSEITYEESKPGVQNLIDIQAAITGRPRDAIVASYAGKMYGHLKVETADIVISALAPIREKTEQLMSDKAYLDSILRKGAEKASEKARKTMMKVYERIGFIPGRYTV